MGSLYVGFIRIDFELLVELSWLFVYNEGISMILGLMVLELKLFQIKWKGQGDFVMGEREIRRRLNFVSRK